MFAVNRLNNKVFENTPSHEIRTYLSILVEFVKSYQSQLFIVKNNE